MFVLLFAIIHNLYKFRAKILIFHYAITTQKDIMCTTNNIVKFFIAFLFSSILLGKSNEDEVLKSDLDSLNILTKKSLKELFALQENY